MGQAAFTLAQTGTVSDPPRELMHRQLLKEFPGYTLKTLREEDAQWVAHQVVIMDAFVSVHNQEATRVGKK